MRRAYERFIDYVKIHTTSDEHSGTHPSFAGEFELARLLAKELKSIGMQDVRLDEHCYVYAMLPADERPEHTEGHEGFYHLTDMHGRVADAELDYIIRDHDRTRFEARKCFVAHVADVLNERYGAGTVSVDIRDSYYNMLEKIKPHMQLIDKAKAAVEAVGLNCSEVPVRGGTDGARLSYDGLPCPNLGTGGFNFHGNFECISVERMDKAVEIIINIIRNF